MLRSMTGYGAGEASGCEITIVVELRSVNNRFRDIQLRCPREYMALESRMVKVLKGPFSRGRIDAFVRRVAAAHSTRVVANKSLCDEYTRAIQQMTQSSVGSADSPIPLSFILSQPGVLEVVEDQPDVLGEWGIVETALTMAAQELQAMRVREGVELYTDLKQHLDQLTVLVNQIKAVSAGVNERLRQKLQTRMDRILGDRADLTRVVQEAALLADKADVAEELTRLASHILQFSEALEGDTSVGRRLDFLIQEMNREVNTIGSKAAEHPISRNVVEMKSVLERMREQAANVE